MIIKPIKATIWGGLLFLVPLTVAIVVLGKLFGFMCQLATPFSEWIPLDSIGGIAIANIVTVVLVLLISFVAGLVGTSVWGRQVQQSLEEKLLLIFPRYTFVKSITGSMSAERVNEIMRPVKVRFDDNLQIAFEVERNDEGLVTVFLPGSPDPWSGSVVYFEAERVEPISADYTSIIRSLRSAGRGSSALLA
ncbi:MAG: DUF502 domain-containing protein [Betaproteobacteria bacterium]|nr:MAG: DUF502 domain-containing protein [Betaproteobacteria bacterium]